MPGPDLDDAGKGGGEDAVQKALRSGTVSRLEVLSDFGARQREE